MKKYTRREHRDDTRPDPPKHWRFTGRDQAIVQAIHHFEGFLSVNQVCSLFFSPTTAGQRKAHERLSYMWRARILNRPTTQERGLLPDLIYWLDRGGAEYVASRSGSVLNSDFYWIKKPRFFSVPHDLTLNDFHILIMRACELNRVHLMEWVSSWEFTNSPDVIEFNDHRGKRVSKKMLPDSYFSIMAGKRELRFMVEIDTATETNYNVIYEKVIPNYAYIESRHYRHRFGHNSGRRIVITDGQRRAQKLLERINAVLDPKEAQFILITTFDQVTEQSVLTEPIWYKGGSNQLVSLLDG